jgi:hypothetical protein
VTGVSRNLWEDDVRLTMAANDARSGRKMRHDWIWKTALVAVLAVIVAKWAFAQFPATRNIAAYL